MIGLLFSIKKMSLMEEITVKNLDHLGIVAGLIDEIGIVEIINHKLGVDNREKITAGQVIKALIPGRLRNGITSSIFV